MALGPPIAGWCRDHWHTAAAALLFAVTVYLAILPLFLLFKIGVGRSRKRRA
jgi:hypothetical protein